MKISAMIQERGYLRGTTVDIADDSDVARTLRRQRAAKSRLDEIRRNRNDFDNVSLGEALERACETQKGADEIYLPQIQLAESELEEAAQERHAALGQLRESNPELWGKVTDVLRGRDVKFY